MVPRTRIGSQTVVELFKIIKYKDCGNWINGKICSIEEVFYKYI
jgi:hypothetical protein